jgi:glycosyltransferase involved in cell wall biosynthesis
MEQVKVSIVIVARNEEMTIEKVITGAVDLLEHLHYVYEIIVNDDASIDQTLSIVRKLQKHNKHIKIYHQRRPIGIAQGVELLYSKASLDYVYILPGDGQYVIEDLPPMVKLALHGSDIVVGRRIHKQYTLWRRFVSFMFNTLSRLVFAVDCIDAGSTKLYERSVLQNIRPISHGVFNEAERIIRAKRAGYVISESPVHHVERKGGVSSGGQVPLIMEALRDMVRLYFSFFSHTTKSSEESRGY